MKYAKRIVSLLLLLSITAGSTAALATENVQITASDVAAEDTVAVQNTNPTIKIINYPYQAEYPGVVIRTNFQKPSNPNEAPVLYRSVNGGEFKAFPFGVDYVYYRYNNTDSNSGKSLLEYQDGSCKNRKFYQYKLATTLTDPSTGETSAVAWSKVKSRYYLDYMSCWHLTYKRSFKKKTITISWKKQYNPKADGYQIRYNHELNSGKESKKITRTIKNKHTTKYVLKNCISSRRYFFEIRSYKKYKGTTYYGNWSDGLPIHSKYQA